MRRFAALLLLAGCSGTTPAPAFRPHPAEAEVMAPIHRLFDGMRAGDSTAVRAAFHPRATMASVGSRDGRAELRIDPGGLDAFVRAVGTPHDEVWDERIWDPVIHTDGDLASVWLPYAFFLGDRLSHCGVDAIQLLREESGWRIVHLADTRHREGCTVPPHAR